MLCVTMAGCGGVASLGHVKLEHMGREVVDVPLIELDEAGRTCVLDKDVLADFGGPSVFYGISGAPVVVDGTTIGALAYQKQLSIQIPWSDSVIVQYVCVKDMLRVADGADRLLADDVRKRGRLEVSGDDVAPGRYMAAMYLWGDVRLGMVGVVTNVDARGRVVMLGHPIDRETMALRNSAMCTADLLAVRLQDRPPTWDWNHLGSVERRSVGAFYYEGPYGPVGQTGVQCPTVEITIVGTLGAHLHVFLAGNQDVSRELGRLSTAVEAECVCGTPDMTVAWQVDQDETGTGTWGDALRAVAALAARVASVGGNARIHLDVERSRE